MIMYELNIYKHDDKRYLRKEEMLVETKRLIKYRNK